MEPDAGTEHREMVAALRKRMADPSAPVLEALLSVLDMHSRSEVLDDEGPRLVVCEGCGHPAEHCPTLDVIAAALDGTTAL